MSRVYIEDKTFKKTDFTINELEKGDYDNCVFINCNFSNIDLSNNNCNYLGTRKKRYKT